MYKVFITSPQFIPFGTFPTYEEAYKVVERQLPREFKMEIHQEDESGNIVNIFSFKSPSYVGYF